MKRLETIFNELNELEKDLGVYALWNIENRYCKYYLKNHPRWDRIKDVCAMNYVFMEAEEKEKENANKQQTKRS